MALSQYALCNGGNKVTNVVTWDGNNATWQPAPGITPRLLNDNINAEIGDTYDGTTLTKAPPSPAKLADVNRAALFAKAQQALAANDAFLAISSPTQGQTLAYVQTVAKELNALVRLAIGAYDTITGT